MERICLLLLFWEFRHSNYLPHSNTHCIAAKAKTGAKKKKRSWIAVENTQPFYPHIFPTSQCLGIHCWNVKLYQGRNMLPCRQEAKIPHDSASKAIFNLNLNCFVNLMLSNTRLCPDLFFQTGASLLSASALHYPCLQLEIRGQRGTCIRLHFI